MPVNTSNGVVIVDWADVQSPTADLHEAIAAAFGSAPDCLGIVFVANVPGYTALRAKLLPQASAFASLPDEKKRMYERPESFYSFGWSHGKEIFNGRPDTAKGSYYNNPVYDAPGEPDREGVEANGDRGKHSNDAALLAKASFYNAPNVWPQGSDSPDLESAFKKLGQLIVKVGQALAHHCDAYVVSVKPTARPNVLHRMIASSKSCKARLLHYFPRADGGDKLADDPASWCGWHLDHGALTGLTSAMFMKDEGQEIPNPDPEAGLYIRDRQGKLVKAVIPRDCIAFQMGQCTQIESGGVLRATWHSVQAAAGPAAIGVARNTFAVFMQPSFDYILEPIEGSTPDGIDTAEYQIGQTFTDFSEVVLKKYAA